MDCAGQAAANKQLTLFQSISGGGPFPISGGTLANGTTDGNGYFRIVYKAENEEQLILKENAGFGYSEIMNKIPQGKNISDIKAYEFPKYNYQVSLNVTNPHNLVTH